MATWFIEKEQYYQQLTGGEHAMLEDCVAQKCRAFSYTYYHDSGDSVTYRFDLVHMTQKNEQTGKVRKLLRLATERTHIILSPFLQDNVNAGVQKVLEDYP